MNIREMKRSNEHESVSVVEKKACTEVESSTCLLTKPCQVPVYLRESEFWKSLNREDDEEFEVPCMKENMCVESFQDACDLLETMRFWGANVSLSTLVQFAVKQPLDDVKTKLAAFEREFPLVRGLTELMGRKYSDKKRMEVAMASGVIELVEFMEEVVPIFPMQALACAAAAGHVNCLQYALSRHVDGTFQKAGSVYKVAVVNGQLPCLKLLDNSQLSISEFKRGAQSKCPQWCSDIAALACAYGQLECLQFLHACGLDFWTGTALFKACVAAVKYDQIACLTHLHGEGCALTSAMFRTAAANGSQKCLQYLHEHGCAWDPATCQIAALNGHVECLKYAREHGSPCDDKFGLYVTSWGSSKEQIIEFARANGWTVWRHEEARRL